MLSVYLFADDAKLIMPINSIDIASKYFKINALTPNTKTTKSNTFKREDIKSQIDYIISILACIKRFAYYFDDPWVIK